MATLAVRKHIATPWLVNEFTLTSDTLEISVRKTDLGPGRSRKEIILPLSTITSVETRSRFRLLKLILGVFATQLGGYQLIEVITVQPNLVGSIVATLLFLPAGVLLLTQVITGQLVIRVESGKKEGIDFSVGEHDAVQAFADSVGRAAASPTVHDPTTKRGMLQRWLVSLIAAAGVSLALIIGALYLDGAFDPPPEEQFTASIVEMLQEEGVSESSAECVAQGLRDGGYLDGMVDLFESESERIGDFSVSEMLRSGVSDAPPEIQHFMEGFFLYGFDPTVGCLSPSELTAVAGGAPDVFSDPVVVAVTGSLTTGCQNGSLADCDMLWLAAEPGSSAQNVAETCGDQNEPLDFTRTTCIIGYQSFADYQALIDECRTGFYLACDALYVVSDIGSEDETLAATCGGRREPNVNLPCWAEYGFGSRG